MVKSMDSSAEIMGGPRVLYRKYFLGLTRALILDPCSLGSAEMLTVAHMSHCRSFLSKVSQLFNKDVAQSGALMQFLFLVCPIGLGILIRHPEKDLGSILWVSPISSHCSRSFAPCRWG